MITVEFDKPPGFDEWLADVLSDGIARRIVEAAIQKVNGDGDSGAAS